MVQCIWLLELAAAAAALELYKFWGRWGYNLNLHSSLRLRYDDSTVVFRSYLSPLYLICLYCCLGNDDTSDRDIRGFMPFMTNDICCGNLSDPRFCFALHFCAVNVNITLVTYLWQHYVRFGTVLTNGRSNICLVSEGVASLLMLVIQFIHGTVHMIVGAGCSCSSFGIVQIMRAVRIQSQFA